MATGSFNLPLLSIPLYYVLAVFPHGYAVATANKESIMKHDNRNPNGSTYKENLKKRLTQREYAAYERAESCHRNHLENMPLYVATVFAGLLAEQQAGEGRVGLNQFVMAWMLIRIVYTANYITTETVKWTYLRSMLYFAGTGWAFAVLGKSAMVFGN